MAELRYNPLLADWTMVSAERQNRPSGAQGMCPFCPGSGKVPDVYEVYAYDNDFPVLSPNPPQPDDTGHGLYRSLPAYGKCEVILYSSDHKASMSHLTVEKIAQVIALWQDRVRVLQQNPKHRYVFIFENRGAEIGATIAHPHGQIYAYPYVPLKIQRELDSSRQYFEAHRRCLLCDMNAEEQRFGGRMLDQTRGFLSYVPFFTDYPYGAFIAPRRHMASLRDVTEPERVELATLLKRVTMGLDTLFHEPMPYMMVVHQAPVADDAVRDYYHWHIEFYPSLRAEGKIKYLASSEAGAWAPANPASVEITAPQLRQAMERMRGNET